MEINVTEIDGRLIMLTNQRDSAQNQCVMLAGELAKVRKELEDLKKQQADGKDSTN